MIGPDLYKSVMRQHAASVVVISPRATDELQFMTATAFTPVSLEPPLVLFCIHKTSDTHRLLQIGSDVGISLLSDKQESLSRRFSSKAADRYAVGDVEIASGPGRTFLLAGSCAVMEVRVTETHNAGDHSIFVGEVLWATAESDSLKSPLVYHSGRYASIAAH